MGSTPGPPEGTHPVTPLFSCSKLPGLGYEWWQLQETDTTLMLLFLLCGRCGTSCTPSPTGITSAMQSVQWMLSLALCTYELLVIIPLKYEWLLSKFYSQEKLRHGRVTFKLSFWQSEPAQRFLPFYTILLSRLPPWGSKLAVLLAGRGPTPVAELLSSWKICENYPVQYLGRVAAETFCMCG